MNDQDGQDSQDDLDSLRQMGILARELRDEAKKLAKEIDEFDRSKYASEERASVAFDATVIQYQRLADKRSEIIYDFADRVTKYRVTKHGVKESVSFSIAVTPDDATIHYAEWTFDFPDSANMGTISKAMLQAAMDTRNRLRRRLKEINIQNARDEQEEREALEVVNTIVTRGNE